MGLYDGYQLSNSNRVQEYQGSVVPELMQVAGVQQQRYDAAQEGLDYSSRFLNSLKAHPNDVEQFKGWSGGYRDKINQISQRKDLEHAVREVTILGRNLPAEYQGFATRAKDLSEYTASVDELVKKGDISPETKQKLLNASMYFDKQNGGIKKDANGMYTGRFTGVDAVKEVDTDKKVDEWMDKALPSTQGWTRERIGNEWIFKQHGKTVDMPADRIREIIRTGAAADVEYQRQLKQEKLLGTYNMDYSKTDPNTLNLSSVEGSYKQRVGTGKEAKTIDTPYTTEEVVKDLMQKGFSFGDAMKQIQSSRIENGMMRKAADYGVIKYTRHDTESSNEVKENGYGIQRKLDETMPIGASILQPLSGSNLPTPQALNNKITEYDNANKATYTQFTNWSNQYGIKVVDAAGNPASPYDAGARFIGADGKERTSEARKFIDAQQQAARGSQELGARRDNLMKKAGFILTPELQKKAEAAYSDAAYDSQSTKLAETYTGRDYYQYLAEHQQAAYDKVLENTPGFKQYKNLLEQDAKDNAVPVGITTFRSVKLNTGVENMFNNLSTNLDANGLEYGTQGLQWGSGPNTGKPLAADDYKKVVGKGKFAGVGLDTDGNYKMFYKVGTDKADGKGDNIIVKMPAPPSVATMLVKEGQVTEAQQYLAQNILNGLTSQNSMRLPISDTQYVIIDKAVASDKSTDRANSQTEYKITYPGKKGGSFEFAASSIDEAVQHLLNTIKTQ